MKFLYLATLALGLLIAAPTATQAKINVFACEPEWAALTTEIGGDLVRVMSATSAQEDPHHVRAKPSLVAFMRQADLVICSGSSLEIGWLPLLLQKSGGIQVQPGQPGNLMASDFVRRLEIPESLDRSQGDIHPEGNPHVHLDARNIARVAAELEKRLSWIDPGNREAYRDRLTRFLDRWNAAVAGWEANAVGLRNMPIMVHHKSWTYLIDWLGLSEVATLEARPGIPPTASHLAALLDTARTKKVAVIVRTPFDPDGPARWLSEKSGIDVLVLPYTVGGNGQSGDLFALFDTTLAALLSAKPR